MRLEGMDYSFNNPEGQRTNSTTGYHPKNISILTALNDDMFRRLAPTVVVLVAVMVVGVAGNILICYIFTRKLRRNSQNFLLLCLGIFDLLSSCVGVPSEIFDVRHYYLYESVEICKAMRFLTTFPSLASILVLLVIAVDRYRKICKPLHHQIHLSHARIALIIIVAIAFTLSVPALYIYGHRSFPTPVAGVYGYDCSVDDALKDKPYPLIYEGIFLAAFLVCTVVLASIYIRIWLETRRHIKYLETHATFGTGFLDETTTSSLNFEDSSLENILDDISQTRSRKASQKPLKKKRSSSHSHRKVSSSPTFLRGSDSTGRFQAPAVIRLTKKPSQNKIKNDITTAETCNCRWQIGSGNDDCDLDNGVSEALYELQNLKTDNEVSRKFNSQALGSEEIHESTTMTKNHENMKTQPKSLLRKDFDNPVEQRGSSQTTYSEGGRGMSSNKSVVFNQEIAVDLQQIPVGKNLSQQHLKTTNPELSKAEDIKEVDKYDASDNGQSAFTSGKNKDNCQTKGGKEQFYGASSNQTGSLLQGKRDFVRYSRVPTQPFENQDGLLKGNTSQNGVQLSQNSSLVLSEDGFELSEYATTTQTPDIYKVPARALQHSKSNQSLLIAKRVRKALRATRTTIIAFTITIGFILSYLPHLILIILRSVKTDFEHHFDDVSLIFYNIFIRSYFANNVINIFVYGTMNLEFRTQILNVWSKVKCSKEVK